MQDLEFVVSIRLPPRAPFSSFVEPDDQSISRRGGCAVLRTVIAHRYLVQLCVFGIGLLEDEDVGVGLLPKCEEVLISNF